MCKTAYGGLKILRMTKNECLPVPDSLKSNELIAIKSNMNYEKKKILIDTYLGDKNLM